MKLLSTILFSALVLKRFDCIMLNTFDIFQAKEEMARQELRNKLSHADQDVMEAYKKISAARSKKKPPSKKEREQAWKALKEREIILKQLESI